MNSEVNFHSKEKAVQLHEWCIVEVGAYCPSGFAIAKFNGENWEDEDGRTEINSYVTAWAYLGEPE